MSRPAAGPGPVLAAVVFATLSTAVDLVLVAIALGGAGALLRHPVAPALITAWWVGNVALGVMRPARGHDPGAIAWDRGTMAALFAIPLATPPLSALGERLGVAILPGGPPLAWTGVALSAFGLALRIVAMARLGRRFSPFVALQKEHALETGGPYALVRHPGYLGAWLASAGAMLAFRSALALPLVVAMLLLYRARMLREEEMLAGEFGETFEAYRTRTGMFFPRLGPRLGPRAGPR